MRVSRNAILGMARVALAGAIVMVSQGCATPGRPAKTVVTDREPSLRERMSPSGLSKAVLAQVERGGGDASIPFARLEVHFQCTREEEDGRTVKREGAETILNAGNGLVQLESVWSGNSLPYRINSRLTYGGMVVLRSQVAYLNRAAPEPTSEATSLTSFAPEVLHPVPGKEYVFVTAFNRAGKTSQETFTCRGGPAAPASDLSADLKGQVFEMACETRNERGTPIQRSKYALLEEYGVALQVDYVDYHVKEPRRIVGIKLSL